MRIWRIAEAVRRKISYETIHDITKIDIWFIDKIAILVEMEQALKEQELTEELLREAKRIEFPDNVIGQLTGKTTDEIHDLRKEWGITASYKMAQQNLQQPLLTIILCMEERTRQTEQLTRRKS